jgi:hypothetical protein
MSTSGGITTTDYNHLSIELAQADSTPAPERLLFHGAFFLLTYLTILARYSPTEHFFMFYPPRKTDRTRCPTLPLLESGIFLSNPVSKER